ncbi:MAG: methyltransferase domain-containing protein [Phycisphaeraceae bacterium]|nr:methyltransferase domain-containing protein [Phycisphaerales bacterium]MCB9859481.1 methyltransferase domain-containing protein [Phycisphaeraceae bacterium]
MDQMDQKNTRINTGTSVAPRRDGSAMPEAIANAIAPQRPFDDKTFEELASGYNFLETSDRRRVFARLIIKECDRVRMEREAAGSSDPVRVLDVGCGRGIGREVDYTRAMRHHIDDFWGIEPDNTVTPEDGLFDHMQHALMETADLPDDHFDVVYSFMVMEHVADPDGYMSAVSRVLKPGGVHIFMTPNKKHYFTLTASIMHSMKIDELILRLIKRSSKDEYHYPVQYKCNSKTQIDAIASKTGFDKPTYAFLEADGPRGYFPGPTKILFYLLRKKRAVIRNPQVLLTLTARMVKK